MEKNENEREKKHCGAFVGETCAMFIIVAGCLQHFRNVISGLGWNWYSTTFSGYNKNVYTIRDPNDFLMCWLLHLWICMCLCVLHTHFYCSFCSYLEKLYLFVFVNIFCRNKRSCKCWMLSILSANEKRSTLVFVWMVVVVVISSFSSYLEGIPLCVSMFILHIYENILYSLQPHRFACMLPLHIYNKKLHLRSSSVSLSL